MSDDVKLTYLKTLVSGKAKNVYADFAYSGTFYKNALKTLERKFRQSQATRAAHLEKRSKFPLSKCTIQKALSVSLQVYLVSSLF